VDNDTGGGLAFLVIAGIPIYSFFNDGWSNSLWYSFQYGVGFSDVHTDAKPSDCDFLQAPLGLKGCSYKAHVEVFNAGGMMVGGEGAPLYGKYTATGKPIFSYDGGKTWGWITGTPDLQPRTVNVSWVKE
jgi:hypothetical protein